MRNLVRQSMHVSSLGLEDLAIQPLPRVGVFEQYNGAMYELETGRKGVTKPSLTLDMVC